MKIGSAWALVAMIALSGPAIAQEANEQTHDMPMVSDKQLGLVRIGDQTALRLTDAGTFTAEQRANQVREAILTALKQPGQETLGQFDIQESVAVETQNNLPIVTVNAQPVVTVTSADTRVHGMQADDLAERWEHSIESALAGLDLAAGTRLANLDEHFTVAVTGVGEPLPPEATLAASDERIAAGVRNTLNTETAFREAGLVDEIRIDVVNGVVTLWGDVESEAMEEQLIERIQDMPGVKAVVNRVDVRGSAFR